MKYPLAYDDSIPIFNVTPVIKPIDITPIVETPIIKEPVIEARVIDTPQLNEIINEPIMITSQSEILKPVTTIDDSGMMIAQPDNIPVAFMPDLSQPDIIPKAEIRNVISDEQAIIASNESPSIMNAIPVNDTVSAKEQVRLYNQERTDEAAIIDTKNIADRIAEKKKQDAKVIEVKAETVKAKTAVKKKGFIDSLTDYIYNLITK
jgi:hypothetical protein